MAVPVRVTKFKGYTSRKNRVGDDPALGAIAYNCIINKGDLCNLPYALAKNVNTPFNTTIDLIGLYYREVGQGTRVLGIYAIVYKSNSIYILSTSDDKDLTDTLFVSTSLIILNDFMPNEIMDVSETKNGNLLQIGEYVFFTSLFYHSPLRQSGSNIYSSMIRIANIGVWTTALGGRVVPPYTNQILPLGLDPPYKVELEAIGSGSSIPNGTYSFAVSLRTNISKKSGNGFHRDITNYHPDDIESSAIISESTVLVTNSQDIRVKIQSPYKNENNHIMSGIDIGLAIYGKNESQNTYYLIGYIDNYNSLSPIILPNGELARYIDVTTFNQVLTTIAPLTGDVPIAGAHDKPRPCYHAVFYSDRMYYFCLGTPKNLMQISAIPSDIDPNQAKYACYIEHQVQIGEDSEGFGGAVEFLGQLVVFKETKTFIITGDLLAGGEIRSLFPDIGCVGIDGGHPYININNVIYWLSKDGVYAWTGEARPIKISEPIEEDLAQIPREDYNLARFSVDTRYGLLFICFPNQKTFVLHYEERGDNPVWTTTDEMLAVLNRTTRINREINTTKINREIVYYIKRNELGLMGLIDEYANDSSNVRSVIWKSQYLDFNFSGRKHWKSFKYLDRIPNNLLFFKKTVSTENLPSVEEINANTLMHLGIHSELLSVQISINTGRAFRISGYEIDAHIKGKQLAR